MSTTVISGRGVKPFTNDERAFAAQHHDLVERYLSLFHLPTDEWYDVAVFGFLRAVRNWIRRSELHKYKFSTIAFRSMSSSVSAERRMQGKRIHAVSLDAVLPDTEHFTLLDTISERHLQYVPYLPEEDMRITYNVEVPQFPGNRTVCEENLALIQFLKNSHKNMCFEYDTAKEAKSRATTMRGFQERNGWQGYYNINQAGNKLYVTRGKKEVPQE